MSVYIHNIATETPARVFSQIFLCEQMQRWANNDRERRFIRGIYPSSGIETRHFVVSDDGNDAAGIFSRQGLDGPPTVPGTEARNSLFIEASKALSVSVAKTAMETCVGITAEEVTHVIAVSCTGFYNPGPDFYIVRDLKLNASVERYCLGFMGCHAALPALKMAKQFCEADAQAVVLVVCVELCSLHLQFDGHPDALVANALFADGAAAAIVSAQKPQGDVAYCLSGFASFVVPEGEKEMAWNIGDHGFRLVLSSYVSKVIGANIRPLLMRALANWRLVPENINWWAVHPGGKTIVDRVADEMQLRNEQVQASRDVLRQYGNMSSATILFVLHQLWVDSVDGQVCALAFGPGLTVEIAHMNVVRNHG
jgi:predicted naringenin-chalcone synthase